MLDQQKISMGRVRQAYGLKGNDVEKVLQALWPNAIFPVELWRRAYETYWRAFADSNQSVYNIESPALPEINLSAKYFHPHLCAFDVQAFFRKLSLNIQSGTLREGLNYILEEAYEDIEAVFSEEREFLFNTLAQLEKTDGFEQYSPDSELFEEKILSVPVSSYHFIAHIFTDTMLVDRAAAIKFLRDYPLRREVKGITRTIVASILNIPVSEVPTAFEKETPLVALETTMPSEKPQAPLSVPTALWKGKTKEHICAVLREKGWDKLEIAHVLFHKRELTGQRAIGKLLHDNPHLTDFAYDKYGKMLFEESKRIVIVDED